MKKVQINLEDSDIATVEALRDVLLENDLISKNSPLFEKSIKLASKMYEAIKQAAYNETRTILEESNDIIFNRAEEKEREYGPIDDSLKDAATVASIIANKNITTDDVYAILISLKVSRLRHNKKHDTYLDCIGYLAAHESYQRKLDNEIQKGIDYIKNLKFQYDE